MKKIIILHFTILLLLPSLSPAAITFDVDGKWETTFDCAEIEDTGLPGFDWGCDEISEGLGGSATEFDLSDGTTDQWTQSTAYPNQYYYSGSKLVAPNASPAQVRQNGSVLDYDLPPGLYQNFSPLTQGQGSYEDVDTLGFDTVYVYSLVDPDTQVSGYIHGLFLHTVYETGDLKTQISSAANNTSGLGGNGARFWKGSGSNFDTGNMAVIFPTKQKEFWMRWYTKYEAGFDWESIVFDKMVYAFTGGTVKQFIGFGSGFEKYAVVSQAGGASYSYPAESTFGWDSVMGGRLSDGEHHSYEIHLKMDSGIADGIAQLWIDGNLIASNTSAFLSYNINLSGSDPDALDGWEYCLFDSNQTKPDNSLIMSVDWDDIVVYNTTPPNTDSAGNAYIGPITAASSSTTLAGIISKGVEHK